MSCPRYSSQSVSAVLASGSGIFFGSSFRYPALKSANIFPMSAAACLRISPSRFKRSSYRKLMVCSFWRWFRWIEYSLNIFKYARTFFQSFSLLAASRIFPNWRSVPRRCMTSMLCSIPQNTKERTTCFPLCTTISTGCSAGSGFPVRSTSTPLERM